MSGTDSLPSLMSSVGVKLRVALFIGLFGLPMFSSQWVKFLHFLANLGKKMPFLVKKLIHKYAEKQQHF
jgi:hypothetical protein